MKYSATIDLSNKNNSHTLAFDLIQSFADGRFLKVLEVGCSAGYFGGAVGSVGHEVWGVEPNQEAAVVASKTLHKVYNGFIQDFFAQNLDTRFDVIVFGDVLEHLNDPDSVLKLCKEHLTDSGAIVASVPNVAHVAIRAMLLEGRWEYSDLGILDRTHVRFYTKSSLVELFTNASYIVRNLHPVQISAEQVDELCKLDLDPKILKVAVKQIKDDCAYDFQYVLLAQPVTETETAAQANKLVVNGSGLRVVCLVSSLDSTLVELRLKLPLVRWAQKNGGAVRFVSIFDHTPNDLGWGDIFILQRDAGDYAVGLIKFLKSNKKKVIFEIDDLLIDLPEFLSHHAASIGVNEKYITESIGLADAVTVTTTRLGDQISRFNKSIFCIPNCAERPIGGVAKHSNVPSNQVTLIVASSDKVLVDFIIPALKAVHLKYGVRIVAIGPPGQMLVDAGLVVERFENMSYHSFRLFLATMDNGVGLIPLDDSNFSSCKSPIKYFDYSQVGLPSVCSGVPPYSDHIVDNETGYIVENTTLAWVSAIEGLVTSSDLRLKIARAAADYVNDNFNLNVAAEGWQQLIARLIPAVPSSREAPKSLNFMPPPSKNLISWVVAKLVSPDAYRKALQVFRKHGITGLLNRIRRR